MHTKYLTKIIKRTEMSDPMNGLIQYLLDHGFPDPIESGLIKTSEPGVATRWKPASSLIYHKEEKGFLWQQELCLRQS